MPIDQLRAKANADEIPAMEELARRLVQGVGVPKDQQAGAGWMLRAAQRGSAQSAFNVGVMYERGFVVERDSARAVEWYRKAADAGLAMAKHNLALMLREGKGAPRDGKEAIELLRSAARQGMSASMFTLGDIYERGDVTPKDQAVALAWFAITAEFESQTNRGGESQLARTATQRVQVLKRVLLPGELERAQQVGQAEFKQIVAALQPPKLPAPALPPPVSSREAAQSTAPVPDPDPPGWPKSAADQIRAVQQALLDLNLVRDKPDGVLGPATRAAIRAFQRSANLRETGEPTKDVYAALREAVARRASVKAPAIDAPNAGDPPGWPVAPVEQIKVVQQALLELNLLRNKPDGDLGPATRDAIRAFQRGANLAETGEPTKDVYAALREAVARREATKKPAADAPKAADQPGWPAAPVEQIKVVQQALFELNLLRNKPDGDLGPATRNAIRAFQRGVNLAETGEPTKDVYAALREAVARREATKTPAADAPKAADPPGWPAAPVEQIKVVQQALFDLDLLRNKPDGDLGPKTRDAIRTFQRGANLAETGEPTKDVYAALQEAIARRNAADTPNAEPEKQATQRAGGPGPPTAAAMIDPGKPETTTAPPTSAEIARAEPKAETPKGDPTAWPAASAEQVSAIQRLLRELNFTREEPDGLPGPLTRAAIREYQASVGLPQTGEPSRELFESLKEMRDLTRRKPN